MSVNLKKIASTIVMGTATAALVVGCGAANTSNTTNTGGSNATNTTNTTNTTNSTGGSSSGVVDYSNASGTIVWAAPPITHTGLRNALIAAFEKKYPNIKVKLQSQPASTDTDRASLTTSITGGSATPDVYMGDVVWPAEFASSNLAEPLSDVLPKSFFDRFSKGLTAGATYNGKIYAAPFFADTAFLFYRKDLLKKYNLPVPTTWEQVKSESQKIQKAGGTKYGFVWQGADYEGLTCNFVEYLADAGGQVLDGSGQPALTSAASTKALTFMRSLITSGVSPKSVDTFQEADAENVFTQGNSAFLRNWSYAWSDSQSKSSKVVGEVGVTPLPTFKGQSGNGYSCVGGWDLYVNPHTKNMAASLQFIDFMTGPTAQGILAKKYSEIPTNASVANDPSLKSLSPVFANLPNIQFVARPSSTPAYPNVSKAIYSNVNQALSGSVSVTAALKNANSQAKSALSSNGL